MSQQPREPATITPPILVLIEQLANIWLSAGPIGGDITVARVRVQGGALELEIAVTGKGELINGKYPVRLVVESTSLEKTQLKIDLPAAKGLGKLMNMGLKAISGKLVNDWLERTLQGAVTLEGENLVVHHAAMLARLDKSGKHSKQKTGQA